MILDWLATGPLLTDGAWGTQLQARGLASGDSPDSWNLDHPAKVEEVARSYVEAGSQVILTNTFRANRISLAAHRMQNLTADINRTGVEISKRAAAGRAKVVASIGPSGKMLMTGEVTEDQLAEVFTEQAAALAQAGADAILCETFSDLDEARIALRAVKATGLPVIVSFAFDTGKNKDRTMMGVTPERAAAAMQEDGASAVGANCGAGIDLFVPLCARLRAACTLPLWIKPNAGLPEFADGQIVYRTSPGQFAAYVPRILEAGASFVGACCGSNPDFIRAMAEVVRT